MDREIELLSLKLADGVRVLRFTDPNSGLSLEKRLDPKDSLAKQTSRWKDAFLAFIERETGTAG